MTRSLLRQHILGLPALSLPVLGLLALCLLAIAPLSRAAEKTYIHARGGDSVSLDPGLVDDGESFRVCDSLYDTLVTYAEESTVVIPSLAERWEITPDGLSYTFHLRPGVLFHDGTPCDANAVLFSLRRQSDSSHPFHKVGGAWKYWKNMGMDTIVKSMEKLDEGTVRFTLNRPEAPFLANLGMNFAAIVSPTAVRKHGSDFGFNPVGTGPFRFISWAKNDRIVLEAFPQHWRGPAKLSKLIFRSIPDNSARLIALQSGQAHSMDFPNPEELPTIRKDAKLKLLQGEGLNVGYMALNMDKKPFDDPRVRRAINLAIPKEKLVNALFPGIGTPAKNPMPPTIWGYHTGIEPLPHDIAQAKKLLAEAGYPDGFKTTLWVMPVPRPYFPSPQKLAQAVQASLRSVGIQAELVTYEWGTYLDKLDNGEHDMALFGWSGDNGDPDNFLYILLGKEAATIPATNVAFYRSDEFNALLVQAKSESDQPTREALYRQAQEIFARDLPWVPLTHMSQFLVQRADVTGLKLHPLLKLNLHGVDLP